VFDGSIVPRPLGLNPSKTIAALAERGVELMMKE
jgi:cholesterol oxidase